MKRSGSVLLAILLIVSLPITNQYDAGMFSVYAQGNTNPLGTALSYILGNITTGFQRFN